MPGLPTYTTRFGSLADYEKGEIDLIDDDPKRYAFSNIFEVAEHSRPYEKVAVGKNRQYVLEAIRPRGRPDGARRRTTSSLSSWTARSRSGCESLGRMTADRPPSAARTRCRASRRGRRWARSSAGEAT